MKILLVHNRYRTRGGEDAVVDTTRALLEARGQKVSLFEKTSHEVRSSLPGKIQAAMSGAYSLAAKREMAARLAHERPDVVHVHNLFPLFSPSVLVACRQAGIPAVMTVHNYRLTCPIGVHFRDGAICERCLNGREYMCLMRNCRDNRPESAAYALRTAVARRFRLFADNVSRYIAISPFLKARLIEAGIPETQITVVPNPVPAPPAIADAGAGSYVAFAGRYSPEKGLDTLIDAARLAPEIPVQIAGVGELDNKLHDSAPPNVRFVGPFNREGLSDFYRSARIFVVPSVWHETFGLVAVEAMGHGIPVVAARVGGLQDLVEEGRYGLLFEPGNPQDLAAKLHELWCDPERCRTMGKLARQSAQQEFNEEIYYHRLMAVYRDALGNPAKLNGPDRE